MYKLFAQRRGRDTVDLPDAPVEAAWLPYLGTGACLYSAVVAYQVSSGCAKERAVADIYGARVRAPLNLFGIGAAEISRRLFSDLVKPIELLKRHTLFGVYGGTLNEAEEQNWAEELALGGGAPVSLANHFYLYAGPLTCWNELRFCPQCVVADISEGRLPEWKLLHQLPFLMCCHLHERVLISRCNGCNEVFDRGADFRVPGQPCRSCGMLPAYAAQKYIPAPEISIGIISNELLISSLEIFRPVNWNNLIRGLVRTSGGRDPAIKLIDNSLRSRWKVGSIDQIFQNRGYSFGLQALELEIDLMTVSRPCLRILIFDAVRCTFGNSLCELSVQPQAVEGDQEELYRVALAVNIPTGVITLLLKGESFQTVSRASLGVKYTRLCTFFKGLPKDLSIFIARARAAKLGMRDRTGFIESDPLTIRREALMKIIENEPTITRAECRVIAGTLVGWLCKNDKKWLDQVLPCKFPIRHPRQRFRSFAEERSAKRKIIIEFKSLHPDCTRAAVCRREQGASKWLREHDRAWFEKQLPLSTSPPGTRSWYRYDVAFKEPRRRLSGHYADNSTRKKAYVTHLKKIIDLNPHLLRSEVERAAPSAVAWLRAHDPGLLERLLPHALPARRRSN